MAKSDHYTPLPIDSPLPSPFLRYPASARRSPVSRFFIAVACLCFAFLVVVCKFDLGPPSWQHMQDLVHYSALTDDDPGSRMLIGSDGEHVNAVDPAPLSDEDLTTKIDPAADVDADADVVPSDAPPASIDAPDAQPILRPLTPRLDYFKGEWQFTTSPTSDPRYNRCPVADKHDQSTKTLKASKQRAKNTLRWAWKPEGPTDWWKWSEEELMLRLLHSSFGVLLIGDSLSGQHYLVVANYFQSLSSRLPPTVPLLIRPSPTTIPNYPKTFPTRFVGAHEVFFLNPEAATILFPQFSHSTRLQRPIITFIRADYLIHKSELVEIITGQIGDHRHISPSSLADKNNDDNDDGDDNEGEVDKKRGEKLPEQWRSWIEYWLRENPWKPDDKIIQERSIVLFNTGAHWTQYGKLFRQPQPSTQSVAREMTLLKQTYQQTAELVMTFFQTFSSELHLIYRANSPGHPYCSASPVQQVPTFLLTMNAASVVGSKASKQKSKSSQWDEFGWERFKELDSIWRHVLSRLVNSTTTTTTTTTTPTSSLSSSSLSWKIDMMEIRAQAAARGDAHNGAFKGDCLHWCLPTIPYQWMIGLGTVIFDKGR